MSSPTKEALARIRELKQRLAEAEGASSEPIAIVATACRFPRRSDSPEAFWESLVEGRDEVTELPESRWDLEAYYDEDPDAPGKMYARKGTFLDRIDEMDADFFGISPREATWVDPQQRLFLEVSWETLERAGWAGDGGGKNTGVFVGWMHNDYQNESSESLLDLNPYIATGSAGSFLCGRLSYYLGIQGPSLAVDTACSSSLVSLHLACQSLRQRECDRALAGGVNVMVCPKTTIMTCKLLALSPKGHSRAFDAAADGYLRGEGCGVVALRRLSDAVRDGDDILAVIRGSAIAHNGHSSGLTAPNPESQQRVIADAVERAGVEPSTVDYLEAHGTGTELGDPIELNAATSVLGPGREADRPLLVGSVKTNLGHLEAGAGIAGVIKTVLAIRHRRLPPHLNFETPNPHIDWDALPVRIVTENVDWPSRGLPLAGVSAFGMSGTNAHVVLEAPPERSAASGETGARGAAPAVSTGEGERRTAASNSPAPEGGSLLLLSGKTEEAVGQLAERYRHWFAAHPEADFADACHSAAAGRCHFERRAAVIAGSCEGAASVLSHLTGGTECDGLVRGRARLDPVVAWQFTGQGSQYVGMGRDLYEHEPTFRQAMDDCTAELAKYRDGDLLEVAFDDADALVDTTWTQPALFSLHIALAELMKSRGMKPDIVLGHSLGQYAAACVAGMLDWREGIRLIHERSRLTGSLPAGGAMAAIFADGDTVEAVMRDHGDLSVAAHNGSHLVVSGPEASVEAVVSTLEGDGVRAKRLATSHAFHSALLDPILDEFECIADSLAWRAAECPLVCNVTGAALPVDRVPDGAYWRRQLREPVQYESSIRALAEHGCDVLLELGPQPILSGMASSSWGGESSALIPTLRRERDDSSSLLEATAQLYVHGVSFDFEAVLGPGPRQGPVLLPTYPFQRRRHWGPERPGAARVEEGTQHPLLGAKMALAGVEGEIRHENRVAPDRQHWLGDHRVFDDIIFPGAGWVEMADAATDGAGVLENLSFEMPLLVGGPVTVQTVVREADESGSVEIHSAAGAGESWVRNVSATLSPAPAAAPERVSLGELQDRCPETADTGAFYERFAALGIHYGPEFRTIRSLHYGERDVLAKLRLEGDWRGYRLPPMLLDGAFQSLAVGLLLDPDSSLFLPVGLERFRRFGAFAGDLWCHGRWHEIEGETRTADLTLFDETGAVVARVEKLQVRAVNRTALRQMVGSSSARLLYSLAWRPLSPEPSQSPPRGTWIVAGESREWTESVAKALAEREQRCVEVTLQDGGNAPAEMEPGEDAASLCATDPEHWSALFSHFFPDGGPGAPNGIVWNTGCPSADVSDRYGEARTRLHCAGILALLEGLRSRKVESLDRGLQLVTQGAVPVEEGDAVVAESSQFWGLGRVVANEYPGLRCRLVDSPATEGSLDPLVELFLAESRECEFALRSGLGHVPRLVPARAPVTAGGVPVVGGATYLVTGGLGMLGRRAAEWLAARGAEHVVLVSRSEPTDSTRERIGRIEESGCRVHVMRADIGDRESLGALLDRIESELPTLRGIIHTAGVLEDGLLVDQTWEGFERVLAPKQRGAALLDEATREMSLDFFLLYSSAASVLGSPGQANYATANAFLDGLAHQRTAAGLPALSVNFGPWNEGMAATDTVTKAMTWQGMTPLTGEEAHEALDRLVDNGLVQATMLDVDWGRMRQRFPVRAPPLLDELWPDAAPGDAGEAVLLEKLREADENGASREKVVGSHVQGELQAVLSLSHPPEPDVPLAELGLDSLMAVEFATRLQQQVGSDYAIPPTVAFDHPSVARLTGHLLELFHSAPAVEEAAPIRTEMAEEAVAIIGLGCRFPGADGIDAYWDLLRDGRDATGEVPRDRWDVDRYYSPQPEAGKMYTKRGGFLPDIAEFDARFFGLSEQDATWMDPQHRMLLEVSWQAMEDAGIVPENLPDPEVGVFMGIMSTDYAQLREQLDPELVEGSQGAGLSHSAGVGRISYLFGFEGPSMAVDTASSSSLVAVCQAARSLLEGECHLALAGGANAILSPINSLLLCKGGVLSPDGRCKSFSANADGFARGEGCGVAVLKRRSDAERDGDRILAVIRGSATGHNGHNGGLTAPSGRSQQRMIRRALENAGLAPADVDYLEAHATGTELGDPIEVQAASEAFGKGRDADDPLLIGSAKANLGHLEAAGGISGLVKVVLAMQHGCIPRQIHFDEPSPHVAWDRIRARVVTDESPWPDPDRLVAGVTALGMTGTNAHVLLEGGPARTVPTAPTGREKSAHLLVLSGRSEEALRELARRYTGVVRDGGDEGLPAVCDSAAVGRRHFEHRAALVADSAAEAETELRALAEGRSGACTSVGKGKKVGKTVWAFPGWESDRFGAGRELYEIEPVFREALEDADRRLRDESGGSLLHALFEDESLRGRPEWTAASLFSLQTALCELWTSWGLEPDLVIGEGTGQYAAASAAGVVSREEGLALAYRAGSLLGPAPSSEADLDAFEAFVDGFDPRPPDRPLICNLTGAAVPVHKVLGGGYWRRHLEEPLRMEESCRTLHEHAIDAILEIGPHSGFAQDLASSAPAGPLPSLLRSLESDRGETASLLAALGALYVDGAEPDFEAIGRPWRTARARLPTYPFQRRRYWIDEPATV